MFAINECSHDLKYSFDKIKEAISIVQQKQKVVINKHRHEMVFTKNYWVVFLRISKTRISVTTGKGRQGHLTGHQKCYAKLAKRCYGPFQVLKPINEMAYQLSY